MLYCINCLVHGALVIQEESCSRQDFSPGVVLRGHFFFIWSCCSSSMPFRSCIANNRGQCGEEAAPEVQLATNTVEHMMLSTTGRNRLHTCSLNSFWKV